jgi:hypothetical protein
MTSVQLEFSKNSVDTYYRSFRHFAYACVITRANYPIRYGNDVKFGIYLHFAGKFQTASHCDVTVELTPVL